MAASWITLLSKPPTAVPTNTKTQAVDPPGFTSANDSKKLQKKTGGNNDAQDAANAELRSMLMVKKSWDVALSPFKALPMQLVMAYFSGSSIQIFSIMMTATLFWSPVKMLASEPLAAFAPFETPATHDRLGMPKLVFILGQLVTIALGMAKLQYMGLLPTTSSDWLAWEVYQPVRSPSSAFALLHASADSCCCSSPGSGTSCGGELVFGLSTLTLSVGVGVRHVAVPTDADELA